MAPWQQELPVSRLRRHRHSDPYVTIVLRGGYRELGDSGSWRVEAGDVLYHAAFEAHLNIVEADRTMVVNLPLASDLPLPPVFRVKDADEILRLARRDPAAAIEGLEPAALIAPLRADWQECLAEAMMQDPGLSLGEWAAGAGLDPATVSRGFKAMFGETPARFRAEARARQALRNLRASPAESLADIAYAHGFSDQAHFTRAVRALTGATPGHWRKVKSIQ
jgi:AraC-like DNA-binding protein